MKHYTEPYLLAPYHPLTVDLVGAGGTGSQVATSLARINHALIALGHPGLKVCIYDDDVVTEANLGRQLFSEQELGMNKAITLATRYNRFFGTWWDAVADRYPSSESTSNITISCTDSVLSRMAIGKHLRSSKNKGDETRPYYWMDFGNTTNSGQVVLGTIGRVKQPQSDGASSLKCVDQLFRLGRVDENESGPSCSLAEALRKQDLFINSTLANLGCDILWKLITEGGVDHQGLYLNLKTMKVNPIMIGNEKSKS